MVKQPTKNSIQERKQAEEALRASEDRFRKVFENASIGIVIADPNRNYLAVNDRFCEITGYSRETLLTLGCGQIVHPDDQEIDVAEIGRLIRGESKSFLRDLRYVHANGSIVWVRVHVSVFHSDSQEGIQIIAVVEDITDRKRAEESLRRFELIAANSRDIVLFMRLDNGQLIEANAAAENAYGYSRKELLTLSIHDLRAAETQALTVDQMAEADVHGILVETIHRRKDGSTFPVEVSSQGSTIGGGRMLISVVRDITERKKAQESLRESEERFRSAFDKGAVPMTMTALDGRLIMVNSAYSKMLGYSESELAGVNFYDITHPADIPSNKIGIDAVVSGEKDSFRMEKRYIRKDGQVIWVDMSTASVRGEDGRPLYIVTHAQDITERKLAEGALRKSEEEYRQLVENAPTGIYEIDFRGPRFKNVNDAMSRILGYSHEELLETNPFEILDEESKGILQERIKRVMAGQPIKESVSYRVFTRDGRKLWVDLDIKLKDPASALVVAHDVTERKRAEEAVRASRKKTETVLASITDMYVSYDNEWRFVDLNPVAEKLMGRTRQELIGKVLWEVFPQLRESEIHEHYLKAVRNKSTKSFEAYSPVTRRWHEFYLYPAEDGLSVYLRDITDRKQMEQALRKSQDELETKVQERTGQLLEANKIVRQSEEKYRELVESARSIILRMDRAGNITFFNEFAEQFFGYSRQEILGRNVVGTIVPETENSGRDLKTLLKDISHNPEKYTNNENENMRKNGERVWIAWTNAPVHDDQGKLLEVLSVGNDLTERKKMEERLRSAQSKLRAMASEIVFADERSRQHFAADLHDSVVQTMGAAKLRSQLIQEKIPPEAQQIFAELQDMLSQSITQTRMIMAEMSPPVLYELGFVPALEWLTEQIESQYDISITFETTEIDSQPLIHEIQVLLFQATRELLMNVVKHAKSECAAVRFSDNGHRVRIEVTDNGTGFDKKQAFRTDISGGGFGLFSIRERLRHFGGELKIRSKPGEGTQVVITAPRVISK